MAREPVDDRTMTGIINLDKPERLSSGTVVRAIKRLVPRRTKVGHAGTLDPFATGVLVLLIGKATQMSNQIMGQPKQYAATIKLGATTATLDPTNPETIVAGALPSPDQVRAVLPRFVGRIEQRPPAFSALKIAGKPAYALARRGQTEDLPARPVEIYAIQLIDYRPPLLRLLIDCGKGTYIRALARDIGQALGSAAYVTELRRTRVGPLRVEAAVSLDRLATAGLEGALLTMDSVCSAMTSV